VRSRVTAIFTLSAIVVVITVELMFILHTRQHYQHGMLQLDVESKEKSLCKNDLFQVLLMKFVPYAALRYHITR